MELGILPLIDTVNLQYSGNLLALFMHFSIVIAEFFKIKLWSQIRAWIN